MKRSTFKTPTYTEAIAKKAEAQKRALKRKKERDKQSIAKGTKPTLKRNSGGSRTINKLGERGKMNTKANQLIREYITSNPIHQCEAKLEGCFVTMYLQVAHKKRRNEYKSAEELADPVNWICACQNCHTEMDRRTPQANELTEQLFNKLRS